jgi:hypothetical protein
LSRKQIVYSMKVEDLLVKGPQYPAQLQITYEGQPIDVLTKAVLYLWNGRNQPITAVDLETTDRLRIEWPEDFVIFEYSIRYQSRDSNRVAIDKSNSNISFSYLNVSDGFVLDVVGTRASTQRLSAAAALVLSKERLSVLSGNHCVRTLILP